MVVNETVFVVIFWFLLLCMMSLARVSAYRYFHAGYVDFVSCLRVFGFLVVLVLFIHYCFIGQKYELTDKEIVNTTTHAIKDVKTVRNGLKIILYDETLAPDEYVKYEGVDDITTANTVEETVYAGTCEWLFFRIQSSENEYVVK